MATEELSPADESLDWKQVEPQRKLPLEILKSEPEPEDATAVDEPAPDGAEGIVAPSRHLRIGNPFSGIRLNLHMPHASSRLRFTNPLAGRTVHLPENPRARLGLAFAAGAAVTLFLMATIAVVAFTASSGKVITGVHIGSVDVSGLNRDQVIAKVQSSYAYLDQGKVSVETPLGQASITYQEAGRQPDVEAMADAAMSVGHGGNPIADAVSILRATIGGTALPVIVRVDPTAVAKHLRSLVGTNRILPVDARVASLNGVFVVSKSATGFGVDEKAVGNKILDRLAQADAPSEFTVSGSFVTLQPQVTDKDAQDALTAAQRMVTDVDLLWADTAPAASVAPAKSAAASGALPAGTYRIDAATIRKWIVFSTRDGGAYGPLADMSKMQAFLSNLSGKIGAAPIEPSVVYDKSGKPASLAGGKDGTGIDLAATSRAIQAHLDELAVGKASTVPVTIIVAPVPPKVTMASLNGIVVIGSWTTEYYPDISNGQGANIAVPATLLNGKIVAPGQQFSFLAAMGPIDEAHGFKKGGVIASGKSDHTGAMGGGICSASTTAFNAAMRAGLEIDERHAHAFYIDRYPVGLDASVYVDQYKTWDMKWTNDTPNPIVIRSYTTPGRTSTMVVELWSLPVSRTVTLSTAYKANVIKAINTTQYTTKLAPGDWGWQETASDGYETSRTRTVTDANGKVIHKDTWNSKYIKVDGLKLIGVSATPVPVPTPTPTPTAEVVSPSKPELATRQTTLG
ncbi:MAG TPA: VanW family protein [Candidatus Limnocylindrales bacterium]